LKEELVISAIMSNRVCKSRLQYCLDSDESSPARIEATHQCQSYRPQLKAKDRIKLAIIGGGVAGLYTAILLNEKYQNKFEINIFEKENKFGGRIDTFRGFQNHDEYQYGEFGAMRIPAEHTPVLDLFAKVNLPHIEFKYSLPGDPEPCYINHIALRKSEINKRIDELGFIRIKLYEGPPPPSPVITPINRTPDPVDLSHIDLYLKDKALFGKYENVAVIYAKVFDHLYELMKPDAVKFFEEYDHYSVYSGFRHILQIWLEEDCFKVPEPSKFQALIDSLMHYAEVIQTGTGLSHISLVEAVIDDSHFRGGGSWRTAEKGMSRLIDGMENLLKESGNVSFHKNHHVMALRPKEDSTVEVIAQRTNEGDNFTGHYDSVVVAVPFSSARFMELPKFSCGKKQGIRSLNYDQATKIFLQFERKWWLDDPRLVGGSSRTDLPLISITYPSYGDRNPATPGVLLTSYTWQSDALMWTKYVGDCKEEEQLKKTVVAHLNTLHSRSDITTENVNVASKIFYEGYALFRPGQFKLMVNAMIPEFGIHFAGEHLSTNHAWILGAVNSANRAAREVAVLQVPGETAKSTWEKIPDHETQGEFDEEHWIKYIHKNVRPQS